MQNIASFLRAFLNHLLHDRGLALRTCQARMFYVRQFLDAHFKSRASKPKLKELTPGIFLQYVLQRSAQDSPGRLRAVASALRSFGRFLNGSSLNRHPLAAALPRIASPGRSCLPEYLTAEQLNRLLNSIETRTESGRRNYAIVLCLARLGLRAAEVAALTLDQIQWRSAVINLAPGKGRRERQLPLPQDLGQALANYLRVRKISPETRRVFCGTRNNKPIGPAAISMLVTRALQRAGIQSPRPGAHLLRRTLACHLIQHGVGLKAVADLLGHGCLDTTRLYTHVDQAMQREVSRAWPTEVLP
jgi:site-specific recombinase XerD